MQGTDEFKKVIQEDIQDRAKHDPNFKGRVELDGKNIDDCLTYILNQVKKSGKVGFADGEVFAMAYKYYEDDNVEVGKEVNDHGRVVVNKSIKAKKEPKAEKTTSQTLYEKAKAKKQAKETSKAKPKSKAKAEPKVVNMPPPKIDKKGQASFLDMFGTVKK